VAEAERPLAIVGGGGWSADAARDLRAFVEASNVPVAASFRRQDYVDNRSPVYAGALTIGMDPTLARRIEEADLLLTVGARLGEIATRGYTLVEPPRPRQRLVHAHPDANEIGRVYEPDLAIVSGSPELCAALRKLEPLDGSRWASWTNAARDAYVDNLRHEPPPAGVDLAEVLRVLRGRLGDDAILTNGAGNYTVWCHRFWEFRSYGTQLAPCSGAMGYGIPAAVAAKTVHPDRPVACVSGDGDFLMSGHELAAALQEQLPILVVVVNNGMYGTIRMHQERQFPGRIVGTDLLNPDFVALAQAFGAHAALVERTEDFERALEAALAAGVPALIELRVDPEAITPRTTISAIRAGVRSRP
jgi:acetolactate synthase I/II/III large subunit